MGFKQTIKNLPKTPTKRVLLSFPLVFLVSLLNLGISSIFDLYYLFNLAYLFQFYYLLALYFLWVRWIANTAEKAGRSRKAFIWVGIFFPLIATFIVIVFKPVESPTPNIET